MATPEEMDVAAKEAAKDLKNLDAKAVTLLSGWWQRWYRTAGHKRLGRLLANHSSLVSEEE